MPSDGIYTMVWSGATDKALDVSGGSTARGANIQAYPRNGTNAQKFIVENITGGLKLKTAASGGALQVGRTSGNAARPGNVGQTVDGTGAQWAVNRTIPVTVDGTSYDGAVLVNKDSISGSQQFLCVTNTLNAELQPYDTQAWAFLPSWIEDKNAPAVGGCVVSDGASVSDNILVIEAGAHIVSLLAQVPDGALARGKARWRMRTASGTIWGRWSSWQSVQGNVSGDDGWGEPWVACDFATTEVDGTTYAIVGAHTSLELARNASAEYQCEVALVSPTATAGFTLGTPVSFTRRVTRKTEIYAAEVAAVVAYDGLRVTYEADKTQGFATAFLAVQDASGNVLCNGRGKAPAKARDTIVVPWSQMARVPDVPEHLRVTLVLTDADGISTVGTFTETTTYDGEHGNEIDPDIEDSGALVRISSSVSGDIPTGTKIWITWQGTTEVVTDSFNPDKVYTAVPPIGVPYVVWFMWNSPSNPDAWASYAHTGTLNPVPSGWFVDALDFSWELPLRVNLKEAPTLTVSYKPSQSSETVMGRTRPVTEFGGSAEKTWSVDAVLTDRYGDDMDELLAAFERCAEGNHVWFRDARGMRERAAVTGAEIDRSRLKDYPIKLDFTAEVN